MDFGRKLTYGRRTHSQRRTDSDTKTFVNKCKHLGSQWTALDTHTHTHTVAPVSWWKNSSRFFNQEANTHTHTHKNVFQLLQKERRVCVGVNWFSRKRDKVKNKRKLSPARNKISKIWK